MDLMEHKERLLSEDFCDHCLGRQFAELGYGLENYERGALVREKEELAREDFVRAKIPNDSTPGGECSLCGGLFNNLNRYVNLIREALREYELDTVLVGTRVPVEIKKKEEKIWQKYGSEYARPIKSELNRLLGKRVQSKLDVGADFKRPDIAVVLDLNRETVELQINSLLIYGQYNKYVRSLPQTKLLCRNCRGGGCPECNGRGRQYLSSVQEIIQSPFLEAAQAEEAKFHGAGREDIDARCFGKREFVLELEKPKRRNLNYKQLINQVNTAQDKVEIFHLQSAKKETIKQLKQKRADKTYRALVKTEATIQEEKLTALDKLVGSIEQRTPQRVAERRPDKVRKREIYKIAAEKFEVKKFDLIVKAEAGAYIKELISGDAGRTTPNAAEILGCKAQCEKLDIIDIDKN